MQPRAPSTGHRNLTLNIETSLLPSPSPQHVPLSHVTWFDESASFRALCGHVPRHMCKMQHLTFSITPPQDKRALLSSLSPAGPINSAALACFSRPRLRSLWRQHVSAKSFSAERTPFYHPIHSLSPFRPTSHVLNRQPNITTPLLAATAPGDMSDPSPMRRTTPVCPYSARPLLCVSACKRPLQALLCTGSIWPVDSVAGTPGRPSLPLAYYMAHC